MSAPTIDATRQRILDTARAHLRRFGEDRMTVVEIARSMKMSHANIYRFFGSKAQIVDALVDEWLAKVEAFLEPIAARPGSAAERIEAVVLELHERRREKLRTDAEVYESFRRAIASRPDAVAKREQKIFQVFRRLIEQGRAGGEFQLEDCDAAAMALEDATAIFLHPLMIPAILNEMTEDRARQVVRCLLAGFSSGAAVAPPRSAAVKKRLGFR